MITNIYPITILNPKENDENDYKLPKLRTYTISGSFKKIKNYEDE